MLTLLFLLLNLWLEWPIDPITPTFSINLNTPPALALYPDYPSLLTRVDKSTSLELMHPLDLMDLSEIGFPHASVRRVVLSDLKQLIESAAAEKINLKILSAYRSPQTQSDLFENYVQQYGYVNTATFSAQPFHSEHQLGTAIDFGTGKKTDLTTQFSLEPAGIWLRENAHRFGFILSYPSGKEHLTGYLYEPWHYRYVGRANALVLKQTNLLLSEYAELSQQRLTRHLISTQQVLGWRDPPDGL